MCNKKDEASSEAEDLGEEMNVEDYAESEWDELDDQDFAERLAKMAMADDPNDMDWIPARLRGKKGKTYQICWLCLSATVISCLHLAQFVVNDLLCPSLQYFVEIQIFGREISQMNTLHDDKIINH